MQPRELRNPIPIVPHCMIQIKINTEIARDREGERCYERGSGDRRHKPVRPSDTEMPQRDRDDRRCGDRAWTTPRLHRSPLAGPMPIRIPIPTRSWALLIELRRERSGGSGRRGGGRRRTGGVDMQAAPWRRGDDIHERICGGEFMRT